MITNVEGIINRVIQRRRQDNFPSDAFSNNSMYVTSRHPDPGLGDSEAYEGSEVVLCGEPDNPQQVIEHETALSTDAVAIEYRNLKRRRKEILNNRSSQLRAKWASLLATERVQKIFFAPVEAMVFRRPYYQRIKVGLRTVRIPVVLKERYEMRSRKITDYVLSRGRRVRVVRKVAVPTLVRPRVWREIQRPVYERRLIRAGGLVSKRIRVPKQVLVRDWESIRAKYAEYKLQIFEQTESELRSISERFQALGKKIRQRPPRLMLSYTTHGFCRPYHTYENPAPYQIPDVDRRGTSILRTDVVYDDNTEYGGAYVYTPAYGALKDDDFNSLSPAQIEWFRMPHGLPTSQEYLSVPRFKRQADVLRMLAPSSRIREQAMLAYSTVSSLTKARDYQFQWFRSLMELKDTKQTMATIAKTASAGRGFLNWLASTKTWNQALRNRWQAQLSSLVPRFGTGLRLLSASYLSWKFAIEPTLADVETVISNTTDWLFEIRRALRYVLEDLNDRRNTFHARAKYGDSRRDLRLGRYVDLNPQDRSIEISVPVTIKWPCLIQNVVPGMIGGDTPAVYQEPPHPVVSGVVDWPFPRATLTTRVFTQSGLHSINQVVSGGSAHQVFDASSRQPYLNSRIEPSTMDISVHDIERFIFEKVFSDDALVERIPIYGQSYTSGVVFAEYRIEDLLALLSHSGSALAGFDGLVASLYTGAEELLTRLDLVKTAWELTPLSFVYDWFTNSSTIVTVLANAARSNWSVYNQVPLAINGIHETRRNELLLGTPLYRPTGCRVQEYCSSYSVPSIGGVEFIGRPYQPIMIPETTIRTYRLVLECTDDKVHLERSGLYRVRRGEQTGYESLTDYLPRLSVSINGGKILSLSALIANLFGSR